MVGEAEQRTAAVGVGDERDGGLKDVVVTRHEVEQLHLGQPAVGGGQVAGGVAHHHRPDRPLEPVEVPRHGHLDRSRQVHRLVLAGPVPARHNARRKRCAKQRGCLQHYVNPFTQLVYVNSFTQLCESIHLIM